MKVTVLGGAGDMGRRAVRALGRYPELTEIVVADLDLDRARAVAAANGGAPRFVAARVDVTDRTGLVASLQGSDAVASAVGPFYRFEVPVAEAALAAGVDLVSLCDDHDAAEAVLELDERARAAGRRVITGLGWTPGLSNLLAKKGAAQLDRARAVHCAWAGSSADSRGFAVVLHTLHIFTGRVPSFQQGRPVRVPAGSGGVRLPFAPPLGDVTCFHVGHPEPLTLPRFIEGLEEVTLRGGLTEPFLNRLAVTVARLGLTATPGRKEALGRLIKRWLPLLERIGPKAVACSGLHIQVLGERGGEPWQVIYRVSDHMENLTGVPLAIGAVLLARRAVTQTGVMAPEAPGGPDPDAFLAELQQHGIRVEAADGPAAAGSAPSRRG